MILAHAIVGITAGNTFGNFWYVLIGSVFPDVDHLFILLKHKITPLDKIIDAMRFEEKYGIRFKTKYVHSIFGAALFSLPIIPIDRWGAAYFFLGYLGHLVLDYFDSDEKEYFYPLKKKVRGFLSIGSKFEMVITGVLAILMIWSFWWRF